MRILIVTPAATGSRGGNRVTAARWARLLRQGGHRVTVTTGYQRQRPELLIALHARRSHTSIAAWRQRRGDAPLVVVLTGTDLYRDIHNDADARQSLEWADRLVVLQAAGRLELPRRLRPRVRVIVQSVVPPRGHFRPRRDVFEVCVLGHLREVKDPFRVAEAVRLLPPGSGVTVSHAGRALSPDMAVRARREMAANPRYRWLGELPRWQALRLLARSRALVLSSAMEGGANVVCEAIACGVPVLSSRIPGSIGLLGARYPGYFAYGDTEGLARLLRSLEEEADFRRRLRRCVTHRAPAVDPAVERRHLLDLVDEFQQATPG